MEWADEYLTLGDAVAWALSEGGEAVLAQSQALLGFLKDAMDCDSPEMLVLERNCDGELLLPYRDALDGASELVVAQAKAKEYLTSQLRIDTADAELVARGILWRAASPKGLHGGRDGLGAVPTARLAQSR